MEDMGFKKIGDVADLGMNGLLLRKIDEERASIDVSRSPLLTLVLPSEHHRFQNRDSQREEKVLPAQSAACIGRNPEEFLQAEESL